jgi:hypothetical protein
MYDTYKAMPWLLDPDKVSMSGGSLAPWDRTSLGCMAVFIAAIVISCVLQVIGVF